MTQNKDVKNMLKDAFILFVITLISGLILGTVYELTKEPIRLQKEREIREACKAVFAQAESFEALQYTVPVGMAEEIAGIGVEIGNVFEAKNTAGNVLGYVVQSTTKEGYGGNIVLYVGITNDGILNGISILSIAETPGLGMNAETVLVPQFENVEAVMFDYTKSGSTAPNEIDAISGATVTTKAICNAVNGAVYVVMQDLMKGGN